MKAFQTKENFINMIDCLMDAENKHFEKYIKLNPEDEQRKRDHVIVNAVYVRILSEINELF
jgi:hypothetical protein